MPSDSIEKVIEYSDPHPAPSLRHGGDHLPVSRLWVIALNRGNGISTAPATHSKEHLPIPDGLPWASSWTLHVRALLWEQQVVLGLVHQVTASIVSLD